MWLKILDSPSRVQVWRCSYCARAYELAWPIGGLRELGTEVVGMRGTTTHCVEENDEETRAN
jgi:hypothetical protein